MSTVREEHDLSPTLFYGWLKQFFENGAAVFAKDVSGTTRALERQVDELHRRLA